MSSPYTAFSVGALEMYVQPDNVNISVRSLVNINKSLGGTDYVTHYQSPTNGFYREISITGALLTDIEKLMNLAINKDKVAISSDGVGGCSGTFIVQNINGNPSKPRVMFPGDSPVSGTIQYQYSISLMEVDS